MELLQKPANRWAMCFLLCIASASASSQEPSANEAIAGESADGRAVSGARSRDEEPTTPAAQTEIQKALQTPATAGEQQKSSGDPILDDVLQIIRRRGSILEGTALDPKLTDPSEPAEPTRSKDPAGSFRAAESLLRSARLLESLPHQGAARQQLVHRLRSEASRCLQRALQKSAAAN